MVWMVMSGRSGQRLTLWLEYWEREGEEGDRGVGTGGVPRGEMAVRAKTMAPFSRAWVLSRRAAAWGMGPMVGDGGGKRITATASSRLDTTFTIFEDGGGSTRSSRLRSRPSSAAAASPRPSTPTSATQPLVPAAAAAITSATDQAPWPATWITEPC